MPKLTQQTKSVSETVIKRQAHLLDAKGQVVGRIASKIAGLLIGSSKINQVEYLDMGDEVVVTNSAEVVLTGNKMKDKIYTSYSLYPGGLKKMTAEFLHDKNPTEILRKAVHGMLPKNKLRAKRMKRLHIFANETHSYQNLFSK